MAQKQPQGRQQAPAAPRAAFAQNNAAGRGARKQLTPLEQVQRIDESFQYALNGKKQALLETYGNESAKTKKPMSGNAPVDAKDSALAAVVQAHCLLDAIYEGTKVLEDSRSTTTKSASRKSDVPSVPCRQLACIAAPLMKCLTALSQSCTAMEKELAQKKKELEELKSRSPIIIHVRKPSDATPTSSPLRTAVSRPQDLPLKEKLSPHSSPSKQKTSSTNEMDVLKRSCLLSASPSQANRSTMLIAANADGMALDGDAATSSAVMSKSLPTSLMSEVKMEEDADEEQRRRRSLQKRWRHVGGSVASGAGEENDRAESKKTEVSFTVADSTLL